ncbi:MAG TPA: hypothetical protein DCR44_06730 [Acholeplasmatales bacterium]|nr:hypothetical protein [Acholeplasmatales bacterium]
MRRIALILMLVILTPVFFSCGPGISPDIEAAAGYELLFELPPDCHIVSESFALSTEDTGYTGNYHAEAMLVTATYVIQNEGTAIVMEALVPAPKANDALEYPGFYYRLDAGGTALAGVWMMRYPAASDVVYEAYVARMKTVEDLDPGVAIHRTTFDLPAEGQSAAMPINADNHRILSDDFYRTATHLYFDDVTAPERGKAYGFGAPVELTFDYEAHALTQEIGFAELLLDFAGIDVFHQGIYAVAIDRFLDEDPTAIRKGELFPSNPYERIESVFRYSIPLPSGTTVVTLAQPIWATCHMAEESCVYRFAFDPTRYAGGMIPVTIALSTNRSVIESTYLITDGNLVFDPTRSLLEIDTLATKSVGSLGSRPLTTTTE